MNNFGPKIQDYRFVIVKSQMKIELVENKYFHGISLNSKNVTTISIWHDLEATHVYISFLRQF